MKPAETFDKVSKTYRHEVDKSLPIKGVSSKFFLKGKIDYLLNLLDQSPENSFDILDVGCGVGESHVFFNNSQKKISLTGADLSEDSLKIAKDRYKGNKYILCDAKELPFKDASFSHVMISCVMHHIPPADWQKTINEMMRVLKPNGTLFIFEHNPFNPLTRLAVYRCPFDKDATLLRSGKVQALLRNSKETKTVKTSFLFFTPFSGTFFRKLDQCLDFIPMGAQYCTYATKK